MAIGPKEALKFTEEEKHFLKVLEGEIDAKILKDYNGEEDFSFNFADSPNIPSLFEKINRKKHVLDEIVKRYSKIAIEDSWSETEFYLHSENQMYTIRLIR